MMTNLSFSSTEILLLLGVSLFLIFGIILVGRSIFNKLTNSNLTEKYKDRKWKSPLTARNKYPEVDVFRHRSLFLRVGLVLSLAVTVAAFNWTIVDRKVNIPDDALVIDEDIEIEVPRSDVPPPPPPPPPPPVIEAVPDQMILTADEDIEFVDQSVEVETAIEAPKFNESMAKRDAPPPPPPPPPPKEPEIKEIFKVVEEMPRFPGCENLASIQEKKECSDKKLLEFVYANIRYPSIARENGIEGTVVVQFVVNDDGSVSDINLMRDIGAKCGEEAVRIVGLMNNMPQKWTPGKQRGRPVRVMFTMPIKFKLEYQ